MHGFAALPPPRAQLGWRRTLGVPTDAKLPQVEDAYKNMVRAFHPDAGGDGDKLSELNVAIGEARRELRQS